MAAGVAGDRRRRSPPRARRRRRRTRAFVAHDTLIVKGSRNNDRIALRLEAGQPGILQVDFDDDGTAEHSFDRATFSRIKIFAGRGNDQVRIDQVNGAFADEAVTMYGGRGNDTLDGGDGAELFFGGRGHDAVDGNRGDDTGDPRLRLGQLPLGPGRWQRHRRGPARLRHARLQRRGCR